MPSTPGIGTTATRGTRAQRREEAAKVVPDTTPTPPTPVQQQWPQQTATPETVAQQEDAPTPAPQRSATPATRAEQPQSGAALIANALGLEPKKGPAKEILNTRVLASTSKRLEWFISKNGYAVTNVVDVALQEFLNKAGVPDPDSNGNIAG